VPQSIPEAPSSTIRTRLKISHTLPSCRARCCRVPGVSSAFPSRSCLRTPCLPSKAPCDTISASRRPSATAARQSTRGPHSESPCCP
jgi:hypothetical protein